MAFSAYLSSLQSYQRKVFSIYQYTAFSVYDFLHMDYGFQYTAFGQHTDRVLKTFLFGSVRRPADLTAKRAAEQRGVARRGVEGRGVAWSGLSGTAAKDSSSMALTSELRVLFARH